MMGLEPTTLLAWEAGEDAPSLTQLEKLAYKIYKRPLAIFFMSAPPDLPSPQENFRGMPASAMATIGPDNLLAIRIMRSQQLVLEQLEPSPEVQLPSISPVPNDLGASVTAISKWFGIDHVAVQGLLDLAAAFKYYVGLLEAKGIFVFQQKLQDIQGYCLTHHQFPIICIQSQDEPARKIFTLFHELGHLLLNLGGFYDQKIAKDLLKQHNEVEVFCNKFAHEMVLDRYLFKQYLTQNYLKSDKWDTATLAKVAKQFKVSKEVLILRLKSESYLSEKDVLILRKTLQDEFALLKTDKPKASGGPDFHVINKSQLSKRFVSTISSAYQRGLMSPLEVCQSLRIKSSHISDYL